MEEKRKYNPVVSYDEDGNEVLDWKLTMIYPILVAVFFLILVIAGGKLHPAWILVFTIPIYDSLVKAIIHKDPNEFWIHLLAVAVYLLIGFLSGEWGVGALVFTSIPIYYAVVFFIKRVVLGGKK